MGNCVRLGNHSRERQKLSNNLDRLKIAVKQSSELRKKPTPYKNHTRNVSVKNRISLDQPSHAA